MGSEEISIDNVDSWRRRHTSDVDKRRRTTAYPVGLDELKLFFYRIKTVKIKNLQEMINESIIFLLITQIVFDI